MWFRVARRAFVGVFVLFVPVMALSFALGVPPGLTWLGIAAVAAVSAHVTFGFRCLHCGKPFARTWWRKNPFTNRCLHCGCHLSRCER